MARRRKVKSEQRPVYEGGLYRPLSPDSLQAIHNTSMDVFEKVGVKVAYPPVLDLWKRAGAEVVDKENKIIRMDRNVVEKCVRSSPSEVTLCGREPRHDLVLSGTRTYLGTGGTALNVLDLETGERRPTTIRDVAASARVCDALENIEFFVITCFPGEIEKAHVDVNRFYAALQNTSKHVMGGVYTVEGVKKIVRMAEMIAGSGDALARRPFLSFITATMSPLTMDKDYTELMETACLLNIPLATSTAPITGATAPASLAGTLVQMNVEALSGIVTTQLLNPGHPTLYSTVPTSTDLRTGAFCMGSIEMGMMNAAAAQIAQYYEIPIYNTAGPTESKVPDSQAAYEGAMNVLMSAMAGANFIHHGAGLLESGLTMDYETFVINDEVIGMSRRVLQGIEVDEERLAFECIQRVGPAGNYLADELTTRVMRSDFFYPELADRKPRMVWEQEGQRTAGERARDKARSLLVGHTPLPVEPSVDAGIRSAIPEIRSETGKSYGE